MKIALAASVAVLAAALAWGTPAHALDSAREEEATRAARDQMQKLIPKMQGRWKGSGWVRVSRDTTVAITSEEVVVPQLGGSALLIEGTHRDAKTHELVHHALAILAWDVMRKEFRMGTALSQGRTGSFPGRIEGGRFIWIIEPPPQAARAPLMRYTIELEPPGRWFEVGEGSFDGGKTWSRMLEMTLERVGGAPR
jgi:hypothetical protein